MGIQNSVGVLTATYVEHCTTYIHRCILLIKLRKNQNVISRQMSLKYSLVLFKPFSEVGTLLLANLPIFQHQFTLSLLSPLNFLSDPPCHHPSMFFFTIIFFYFTATSLKVPSDSLSAQQSHSNLYPYSCQSGRSGLWDVVQGEAGCLR